jgi:hypothetical protein
MSYWLTRLGSLMAGGGIAYATYIATKNVDLSDFMHDAFRRILQEHGPMEICAIGILLWMMGKWRSHTLLR